MATEHTPDSNAVPTAQGGRKAWIAPDLILSDIEAETGKLSSTAEFYVPQYHRTLGPS